MRHGQFALPITWYLKPPQMQPFFGCNMLFDIPFVADCRQSRSMFCFLETKIRFRKETKIHFHRIIGNGFLFPTYSKLPAYFWKLLEVRKQNRDPEVKSWSGSKIAIRKQNRDPEAKSLAIKLHQKLLTCRLYFLFNHQPKVNSTSSSNDVAIASPCRAKWPWVYDNGVFTSERTTTIWTILVPLFQH